jgi:hypothetical protein
MAPLRHAELLLAAVDQHCSEILRDTDSAPVPLTKLRDVARDCGIPLPEQPLAGLEAQGGTLPLRDAVDVLARAHVTQRSAAPAEVASNTAPDGEVSAAAAPVAMSDLEHGDSSVSAAAPDPDRLLSSAIWALRSAVTRKTSILSLFTRAPPSAMLSGVPRWATLQQSTSADPSAAGASDADSERARARVDLHAALLQQQQCTALLCENCTQRISPPPDAQQALRCPSCGFMVDLDVVVPLPSPSAPQCAWAFTRRPDVPSAPRPLRFPGYAEQDADTDTRMSDELAHASRADDSRDVASIAIDRFVVIPALRPPPSSAVPPPSPSAPAAASVDAAVAFYVQARAHADARAVLLRAVSRVAEEAWDGYSERFLRRKVEK